MLFFGSLIKGQATEREGGGGGKVVKDTSVVARSLLRGRGRTRIPVFSNASAERVSVIVVAEF